jgi:hypothetical protein
MSEPTKSKLTAFISTAESLTGHPVEFKGGSTLHDYAGINPEFAKLSGWPDKDNAIIIDKNQTEDEQIKDVVHEVVEETEMEQGEDYHDAHVDALEAEKEITTPEQLVQRVAEIKLAGGKCKYKVTSHKSHSGHSTKSVAGLGSTR